MRLVLYTGKGGVGKTTTAAATALCAAERGRRTLVVSADAAHSLADVIGESIGPTPVRIASNLDAIEIDARVEIGRHWGRIRDFLVSIFRHQGIEEVLAEELALIPGAEELTTLLGVEELAREGGYDFVVVDCAPTDTTLRLLTLPEVAHHSLRVLLKLQRSLASLVTPIAQGFISAPLPNASVFDDADSLIYEKLRALARRVTDADTSVRLVVTPEQMTITEAHRALTDLRLFDLQCDAVVMNRLLPEAATAEPFFNEWGAVQKQRLAEVERDFAPLTILRSELREEEARGIEALLDHGRTLFRDHEPYAVLSPPARVRFTREGDHYCVRIPLPGASPGDLQLSKVDGTLLVRAGALRRSLSLPRGMAPLDIHQAKLDAGELRVLFEARDEATAR
jgi:arsenite-transporting ATPase